jgi:hypothetical protein
VKASDLQEHGKLATTAKLAKLHTLNYSAFVRSIGVTLTPFQRVIARVVYDQEPPASEEEREIAEAVFGFDPSAISGTFWRVFVAMCGARGGKSYTLEALRLLHMGLTVPLTTLAPGEVATGLVVAPNLELARQTLRYIAGALAHPMLAGLVVGEPGVDRIVIKRPHDGRRVAFECLPATAGGAAVRARSLVGACMEEAAFFRDKKSAVNDEDVSDAIFPRLVAGAQLIIASTPWLQEGLLYRTWEDNYGDPKDAIAVRATTVQLRPEMSALVAEERRRDPDNAAREFDAVPLSAGAGVFFDPNAIKASIVENTAAFTPEPGDEVIAAADFGFRTNSASLVVAYRRGPRTTLVRVVERRPDTGKPLVLSVVVHEFAEVLRKYRCSNVLADAHYLDRVLEHASREGLSLLGSMDGDAGRSDAHVKAKSALGERLAELPNHPRLLKQLREIIGVPTSGGGVSIKSPQWKTGEHGDLASPAILVIASTGGEEVVRTIDMNDMDERIRRDTKRYWEHEKERIAETHFSQWADSGFDAFEPERFASIA